ncbi:hypothetical protein LCGC14_2424130 [marine sediment metagenome]|uniref:Uncharacterized protein n=1 Tax=marine sediment metagenome TaxID=412755 RepID=A0A0F9CAY8_9ZZZZ
MSKKVNNNKEMLKALKKAKKGETIYFDERKKDTFELSYGNKKVLELIPSMMEDEEYRHALRKLAIEFSCKYSRFSSLIQDVHKRLRKERIK